MLRNRLQHLLLLKFHHALNISIKLLFAALVHFYSVLVEESMIICSSQRFVHGQNLKRSNFFTDETKKVILSCLRLETGSEIYYFWIFTMSQYLHQTSFLGPGAIRLRFTRREQDILFTSAIHPWWEFKKKQIFQMRLKKWFYLVYA